jgi:hypothetical protein
MGGWSERLVASRRPPCTEGVGFVETVGWVAAAMAVVAGVAHVLGYVLDQTVELVEMATKALKAMRRMKSAWRAPDGGDGQR